MWGDIQYFKPEEFDSPDLSGSGRRNMDINFIIKLDTIRRITKVPLHINSGYRTIEHNEKVGGRHWSAHRKGKAADIRCDNTVLRYMIIKEAIKLGINRFGIGASFLHLDVDDTLPGNVMWIYT